MPGWDSRPRTLRETKKEGTMFRLEFYLGALACEM